jgi:hypothetical protein
MVRAGGGRTKSDEGEGGRDTLPCEDLAESCLLAGEAGEASLKLGREGIFRQPPLAQDRPYLHQALITGAKGAL